MHGQRGSAQDDQEELRLRGLAGDKERAGNRSAPWRVSLPTQDEEKAMGRGLLLWLIGIPIPIIILIWLLGGLN